MSQGTGERGPDATAVVIAAEPAPAWVADYPGPTTRPAPDADALAVALRSCDAVLIDAGVEAPLAVARRVRRIAPELQLVLVASPDQARAVSRSALFTPGLGEPWIIDPAQLDPELVRRAAEIARRRRTHARRMGSMSDRVESFRERRSRPPRLPDQYLATVLELLPEPVLALDEHDAILFANPAARRHFDLDDERDKGADLRLVLDPVEPERVDELLRSARPGPAREQLRLRDARGEDRIYDAALATVGGERPIRALILHDMTDVVRSREELSHVLEQRSRFYASMSHELRTPINAIMGYNSLLAEEVYGRLAPEQGAAIGRIGVAARHLLDLVDDVLDLSKLESGKMQLELEDVQPAALVLDLKVTIDPLAKEAGVELRFHIDPECERPIRTDPRRLRQVMLNLLSNAIRYGGGQPVDVHCARGDGLRIDVRDRGPGIEPERLEEIFEEFVQLGNGESAGTGLGLAIARAFARSLGGDITVRSELGAGSTFTLELPEEPPERPVEGGGAGRSPSRSPF